MFAAGTGISIIIIVLDKFEFESNHGFHIIKLSSNLSHHDQSSSRTMGR